MSSDKSLSDFGNGQSPVNFPVNRLDEWRETLSSYAQEYGELYAISDTETTGRSVVEPRNGLFNRVLEWAMLFCYKDKDGFFHPCKDKRGDLIVIDEPINPFLTGPKPTLKQRQSVKDIDPESTEVHGITMDYLTGKSEGAANSEAGVKARPKLSSMMAPTFDTVMSTVQSLLSFESYRESRTLIYLVFHNAPFDIRFLNHECESWDMPHVEGYFGVVDTLKMAKLVFQKSEIEGFSLDDIFQYGKLHYPEMIEDIDRPIHSAMIDVLILLNVSNIITRKRNEKKS